MPKLPRITAREAAARLLSLGFSFVRQTGSHKIYKNAVGKRATIPFHNAKILSLGVIKMIMRDAGIEEW